MSETATLRPFYWRDTPLDAMSPAEWEALCDGCGKCCLLKLEDEDGAVAYTTIACRLFDDRTCRCMSYELRRTLVKDCVVLTPESLAASREWMPRTCAYRLLAEGRDLPDWHPLVTGDPESTHEAGISMRSATIPEYEVAEEDWYDHAVDGEM